MANDIRDAFPHAPCEERGDLVREIGGAGIYLRLDPRGVEQLPRILDLDREDRLPLVGDRAADVAHRRSGKLLDVLHLPTRLLRVGVEEPVRQLALERDQRERMTEHVVQVSRDAEALLRRGHPALGIPGLDQLADHPALSHLPRDEPAEESGEGERGVHDGRVDAREDEDHCDENDRAERGPGRLQGRSGQHDGDRDKDDGRCPNAAVPKDEDE